MKPEIGQLNVFFDKDSVTTSESVEIIKIINAAIGLANLDLINDKNKDKYESLKHSFYGYLYSRNRQFANSLYESFIPIRKYRDDLFLKRIEELRNLLRDRLKESSVENFLFLSEYFYAYDYIRENNYSRQEIEGRLTSEFTNSLIFENRKFNLNDFSEWLNVESENNVSEIGLASTKNSLEYEIKFLIIWGFENHELLKDLTLLAFEYILALINKPREQQRIDSKITIPDVPDNMRKIIEQYDKVDFEIDETSRTMKLKLRKEKKKKKD